MEYTSMLAHIDASRASEDIQNIGAWLAARFEAHLTGLFVEDAIEYRFPTVNQASVDAGCEQRRGGGQRMVDERVQDDFERICRAHNVGAFECRWAAGERVSTLSLHARYVDVVVLSRGDGPRADQSRKPDPALAAKVAMTSARPVIEVPARRKIETLGQRILIAWNASPQATRAITAALPILRQAEFINLMVVNPDTGNTNHGTDPGADIRRYLCRHGIKVESTWVEHDAPSVTSALLDCAYSMDADLVCMGVCGHSRLREFVLGGVTRDLAHEIDVPVLMSH